MLTIYTWIVENWKVFAGIGVLIFLLSISGSITETLRAAKKGLKEVATPLGFFIFLILAYLAYQLYMSAGDIF